MTTVQPQRPALAASRAVSPGARRLRRSLRLTAPAVALLLAAAPAAPAEKLPADFTAAVESFGKGEWRLCRDQFDRARFSASRSGLSARAAYGAAVCSAYLADLDGAFSFLGFAVTRGFHDLTRLHEDPRLSSLRGDVRWVALERQVEAADAAWRLTVNSELLAVYEADLTAHPPGSGKLADSKLEMDDRARFDTVRKVLERGGARLGADYFHAASVLVHSDVAADMEQARALALKADELDPDLLYARRLAAYATDRALMLTKKPQKYGTQLEWRDGRWVVYEVDPKVTDAERAEWNVPPLAETRALAERLSANPTPPAAPAAPPAATPPTPPPPSR
jgi:hypothetical protein